MAEPLNVDWVDAFTDRAFGGNGCAVVHDAGGLSAETCMAFTAETGLVECTFVEPSDVADVKVRYFMATRELPFAGHPTIATVTALVDRGIFGPGTYRLETGAGIVPVEIADGAPPMVVMTQQAPVFGRKIAPDLVSRVGGLATEDILGTPQIVSTGLPFCVTLLRSKDALRRAVLDVAALEELRAEAGDALAGVIEPYWVTRESATAAGDTFARLLLPPPLPQEDYFTGSATGAMAAYLWHHGHLETPHFTAEQGHDLGRPGRAQVELLGPPEAITGVRVGGTGHVLMRGTLSL